jgi:hypothetical protein
LRELAAQNDADALFEIFDMYKSYFRSDVNKPQLVKRAEAEQALRKAAELGHAYATLDTGCVARSWRHGETRQCRRNPLGRARGRAAGKTGAGWTH